MKISRDLWKILINLEFDKSKRKEGSTDLSNPYGQTT